MTPTEPSAPDAPALRVLSGSPTPEEVAALVAVLTALDAGADDDAPAARRSPWSDPAWRLAGAVGRGGRRDAWRTSALPR